MGLKLAPRPVPLVYKKKSALFLFTHSPNTTRCVAHSANDFEDDENDDEMLFINVDKLCHWLCPAVADIVRLKQRVRQFLKSASEDLQERSRGEKQLSE